MELSGRDFARLRYAEQWLTYKASDGALSLNEVIRKDNGRYFSSILSEEDTIVKSFTFDSIPQADAMLVLGYPRVLAYAAEVAVRYRDKYGTYPELVTVGDGRGMFSQRCQMNEWFSEQLVALGFPEEWAFKNYKKQLRKNRNYIADVRLFILPRLPVSRRFKLLVIASAGTSLCIAQELSAAMPHTDFMIFETPQSASEQVFFDHERFSFYTYGVDILLAHIVRSRINTQDVQLPVEKLLSIPSLNFVRNLLMKGYAGCFSSDEMWKYVGIEPEIGRALNQKRLAQLQRRIRPRKFAQQQAKFLEAILKRFERRGLVIKA